MENGDKAGRDDSGRYFTSITINLRLFICPHSSLKRFVRLTITGGMFFPKGKRALTERRVFYLWVVIRSG